MQHADDRREDTDGMSARAGGRYDLRLPGWKANMKAVLSDIQDGTFAGKWIAENKNGRCFFNSKREQLAKHPMEIIGKQLREQMLWKNDSDLDNASN